MKLIACFLVVSTVSIATGLPASAQQTAPPAKPAQAPGAPAPATPDAAPAAPPAPNTLLNGTALKLRLVDTLTSANAKVGQQIPFEVLEEVDVMGVPVVAKGAQALGTVTIAEPKKSMGRAGKLDVNIDSVRLIDGEKAALSATRSEQGGGHTGAMVGGMVATAIVFFPAAPFLLFIHGKDITIPKGTEITAFIAGDMKLEMAKFAPQPPAGAPALAAAAAATTTAITIDASVPNCDIEVDGAFVGNTPSTVAVTPGQHTITVKKKGYADWSRPMTVSGPTANLHADLEAAT